MLWADMATAVPVAAVQRWLTISLFVALIGYKEEQGTDKVAPCIYGMCALHGERRSSQVPHSLFLVAGLSALP